MNGAVLAGLLFAAALPVFSDPGPDPVSMEVKETAARSYDLQGRFKVDAPVPAVWDVLTDYNHIADFVSSLNHSKVIQSGPNGLLLSQEAIGKVLWFSREVRVILVVTEAPPQRIDFEDIAGEDFSFYKGSWEVRPAEGAVEVAYRLQCTRTFAAPDFIARGVMRKNATDLLAEVRTEILKRLKGATP